MFSSLILELSLIKDVTDNQITSLGFSPLFSAQPCGTWIVTNTMSLELCSKIVINLPGVVGEICPCFCKMLLHLQKRQLNGWY